jgi:hypothetical protein
VARGERQSQAVETAIRLEIEQINRKLKGSGLGIPSSRVRSASSGKRLRSLVSRRRRSLRSEWLQHSKADPNLRSIKLPTRKRASPILPVLNEALKAMKLSPREMASLPMKFALQHGRARRDQGYEPAHLLEEYNLIRRCIFAIAEENARHLDDHFLIHDLGQLGEALDLQAQNALRAFIGEA